MSTFIFSALSIALLNLLLRQKMTVSLNISFPYVKYSFPCGDMVTVTIVVFNLGILLFVRNFLGLENFKIRHYFLNLNKIKTGGGDTWQFGSGVKITILFSSLAP